MNRVIKRSSSNKMKPDDNSLIKKGVDTLVIANELSINEDLKTSLLHFYK